MKKLLLILLIGIVFNCNDKKSEQTEIDTLVNQSKEDLEFEHKLKDEPKIFLKYWSGMTYIEYRRISDSLCKENILEKSGMGYYYLTNDCKVFTETVRKNDLVVGIKMTENVDCIYPLFQQKYNLPNMVEMNLLVEHYVENNPKYNPVSTYFNGNAKVTLPSAFIDNSNSISVNEIIQLETNNEYLNQIYTEKVLPKNNFIINNGNNIIIINQEITKSKHSLYRYSLEDSEEMKRYMGTENGQKHFGLGAIGNSDGGEYKYIEQNSKTRTVTTTAYKTVTITYISEKDYQKQKFEKSQKENDERINELMEQKKAQELKEKTLDDI